MTEQEVAKVLYLLNINYKSDAKTNATEMERRLKLWSYEFKDEEAELVNRAVDLHINECEFYPNIAHIKKIIAGIKEERYFFMRYGGGTTIKVGNKVWHANLISEAIKLSEKDSEYLENLWNELKEADAF